MRRSTVLTGLALLAALALPARADKKLDEAAAKAEEQLRKGRPDEALKTLRKAVQQAPGDPAAHRALAALQERQGDLEAAGAGYAKAVEAATAGPAKSTALADLAVFELRTAPSARARAHAEEGVRLDAGAAALAALARVQARVRDPAALPTAERAQKAAPDSAAGHVAMGEALLAVARPEQAAAAFRRALELSTSAGCTAT